MDKKTIVRGRGLFKIYGASPNEIQVLKGINLEIAEGEFVAILGPSGSGKSTLIHLLGAMDFPSRGTVELFGRDLNALPEEDRSLLRNKSIGFVFQFDSLLPEFTLLENVLMPARLRNEKPRRRAEELLERFGLLSVSHRFPQELSGGEGQRAVLARALVNLPRLILADEPTGNLDRHNTELVLNDLRTLSREEGTAVVLVTHNEQASRYSTRTLRLVDGALETSPA